MQARKVDGQAGVCEVLPLKGGVEAFECGFIAALCVLCNRGGDEAPRGRTAWFI